MDFIWFPLTGRLAGNVMKGKGFGLLCVVELLRRRG